MFTTFTLSVEQIFPNGKTEVNLLSSFTFYESFSLDSIFSSFEHQIRYWLEQEALTESSFRFISEVSLSESDL